MLERREKETLQGCVELPQEKWHCCTWLKKIHVPLIGHFFHEKNEDSGATFCPSNGAVLQMGRREFRYLVCIYLQMKGYL
jgi:hypothetical protein